MSENIGVDQGEQYGNRLEILRIDMQPSTHDHIAGAENEDGGR